MVAAS